MSVIKCPEKRKRIRISLWTAQGGLCALCLKPVAHPDDPMPMNHPDGPSLDHVVPKSQGGRNHNNLCLTHRSCNTIKADKAPERDHRTALMIIKSRAKREWKRRIAR